MRQPLSRRLLGSQTMEQAPQLEPRRWRTLLELAIRWRMCTRPSSSHGPIESKSPSPARSAPTAPEHPSKLRLCAPCCSSSSSRAPLTRSCCNCRCLFQRRMMRQWWMLIERHWRLSRHRWLASRPSDPSISLSLSLSASPIHRLTNPHKVIDWHWHWRMFVE